MEREPSLRFREQARNFFGLVLPRVTGLIEAAKANGLNTQEKTDHSLLTDADIAIDHFLTAELQRAFPAFSIITEEGKKPAESTAKEIYVDPIDETHDLDQGGSNYGTLIGFVENNQPTAGAIYLPVQRQLIWAIQNNGVWLRDLKTGRQSNITLKDEPDQPWLTARAGREAFIQPYLSVELASHVRFTPHTNLRGVVNFIIGRTQGHVYGFKTDGGPWDIAALHAITRELGGRVCRSDGTDMQYTPTSVIQHDQGPILFLRPDIAL